MAGRPTKPDHVKDAQGTLRPCRVNEHPLSYDALSRSPEPPKDLNEDGSRFYKYICDLMISKRLLTPAFLFDIERAAFWYEQFKVAQRDVNENGMFEVSEKSGWRQISPLVSVAEKATKFLNEFDGKYGLNLVSGQKIEIPENDEGEPEY